MSILKEIDERARDIFRRLVEIYLKTGEPVGSRTLSQEHDLSLSPASVRNVMADLTDLGLLYAPHVSAGRLPTELGLRLFVDSLLQLGDLTPEERRAIDDFAGAGSGDEFLEETAARLSGLTSSASLVITEKREAPLRHIEFVPTGPGEALVVLVFEDGRIENRVIQTPPGMPQSSFVSAGNYLSACVRGRTLAEAQALISSEIESRRAQLDELTARLVEDGVALFSGASEEPMLIVRGYSRLLNEATAQDLERVRMLFDDLERKQEVVDLLSAAKSGQGVKIFIGAENRLFSLSGSSVIVAPYRDKSQKIVGVLGVIGPTRVNYAKVIPIVDYTAEAVSRMLK